MERNGYIGFLDYGIGGISLLSKAIDKMPYEKYIYIRDSLLLSDTPQTRVALVDSCLRRCNFLVNMGVKAIVIPCDIATMIAIDELKARLDIPLIGMYPTMMAAIESKKIEKVIVLAAEETFYSRKFNKTLKIFQGKKRIYKMACPEIVLLMEKGIIKGRKLEKLIEEYFKSFDLDESTVVVLGNGYYSMISETLRKVLGKKIKIIDSGVEVTDKLFNTLNMLNQINLEGDSVCEIYNLNNEESTEIPSLFLGCDGFDKFCNNFNEIQMFD